MKLFIVLVACLLLVRGHQDNSDDVKPDAEKDDFLFGLIHHAVHGVLSVGHHAVNLVGHILGDEEQRPVPTEAEDEQEKGDFMIGMAHRAIFRNDGYQHLDLDGDEEVAEIQALDKELDALTPDAEEEKQDFLFGLLHHAVRGVLNIGHHALHLIGHVLGDENEEAELDEIFKADNVIKPDSAILVAAAKTDNQEKKDFLFGLLHHAVHGVLGAAHGILHLAGHIIGDNAQKQDKMIMSDEFKMKLDAAILAAAAKTDNQEKKDFLLGLAHHYVRGCLNVGHHALNLLGHIIGDNKEVSLQDVDAVLARLSKTDNQEEKDFLFGLIHHATRCVFGAAHGVLHLAGHILGDEQVKDFNIVLAAAVKADSQEKKDFLFGLIHHAVHGVLGAAHGILHLAGHILGDEHLSPKDVNALFTALSSADTRQEKDFLFGLIHHAGCHHPLNVGHHALNLVGHILGDNELSLEDVDAVLARLSETDNQEEKDFLLGLIHHAVHGVLGAAHGILHLAGHIFGDDKSTLFKLVLHAISKTDNQEKKDFLLGLIHHAVHGVLNVGHHALNLIGHILGDDKDVSPKDIEGVLDEISNTDNQEKKDFLLGLIHHAVHGVLGAAHGVLHLAGHIFGDEKDFKLVLDAISKTDNQENKDFLLGLIHHAVHGVLNVGHHALNLIGHILGDDKGVSPKDF